MVPVGLDDLQQPVGLQFMGRAGPVGDAADSLAYSYDAKILKTVGKQREGRVVGDFEVCKLWTGGLKMEY